MTITRSLASYPGGRTVLGSGKNEAFIYVRGGGRQVAKLPGQVTVQYDRRMDDVSEAHVTVMVTGDHSPDCCGVLPLVHTWAHEIVIFRDGERVWEGPIVRIQQTGNEWIFDAIDVLGYTERRAHKGDVNASPRFAVNIADLMVKAAFSEDDPNVLAYLTTQGLGSGLAIARDVAARSGYYWDDLDALCDQGVSLTVVGRRIVLYPETLTLGRVDVLYPEKHLVSTAQVVEDGMLLSSRAWATGETPDGAAGPITGSSGGVSTYYGLIETISNSPGVTDQAGINAVAAAQQKATYPAGLQLIIPDGSTLTCDAPYTLTELVPGVVIPVSTITGCRKVNGTFLLSQVSVTQTGDAAEQVQINVVPSSPAAPAAAFEDLILDVSDEE